MAAKLREDLDKFKSEIESQMKYQLKDSMIREVENSQIQVMYIVSLYSYVLQFILLIFLFVIYCIVLHLRLTKK